MQRISKYSTYLFPRNSFFIGVGALFNFSGRYFDFNYSQDPEEADFKALQADAAAIAEDFWAVLDAGSFFTETQSRHEEKNPRD